MLGQLKRGFGWFLYTPPDMARDYARMHSGAKIGYALGVLIHGLVVPLFFVLDQPVLAYYNAGSTVISACCFALHLNSREAVAFVIIMVETAVATVLATVYLGLGPGFFLYTVMGPLYTPLVAFLPRMVKSAIIGAMSIGFVGLMIYGIQVAPVAPIPAHWVTLFAIVNGSTVVLLVLAVVLTYHNAVNQAEEALEAEYEKSEALLHNIMPVEVADRLKENPEVIADHHRAVTILFADIVGFTEMSANSSPADLVGMLNEVFSRFDALVEAEGLEKIKTIGDAYMVVAGLPQAREDHAPAMARLALAMQAETEAYSRDADRPLQIRIGINSGEVVAGVIGRKKFAYDLWGDTVNVAARMEGHGVAGRIQVSAETCELLGDAFVTEPRGEIEVKGKGMMEAFFVTGMT